MTGYVRKDAASSLDCIRTCNNFINNSENSSVTLFVQQTIADVNNCGPEDIAPSAYMIHKRTEANIIPVFTEQVSLDQPTRIVFGNPMEASFSAKQFGEVWLDEVLKLQKNFKAKC